mgnify:CR=1 FL=1
MANPVIELNEKQVISVLSQFSPGALKKVIDNLFKKKLYTPPSLKEITREASAVVKKEGIKDKTVEEAIKWARSQR